jgi:hypothetical protein
MFLPSGVTFVEGAIHVARLAFARPDGSLGGCLAFVPHRFDGWCFDEVELEVSWPVAEEQWLGLQQAGKDGGQNLCFGLFWCYALAP